MKFRNLIAAAAVLAVPTFFAGTASATTFTVNASVWENAAIYQSPCTTSACTNLTTPFPIPTGTPDITFNANNSSASVFNLYSNDDANLDEFMTTSYNPLNVTPNGNGGSIFTGISQFFGDSINNDVMDFTGETYLQNGATYSVTHDDGMYLYIDGDTMVTCGAPGEVICSGDATSADTSTFTWTGASGLNNFSLWYAEVNGSPAVLYAPDLAVTPEPSSLLLLGTGLFGLAFLLFRRKSVKPVASPTVIGA